MLFRSLALAAAVVGVLVGPALADDTSPWVALPQLMSAPPVDGTIGPTWAMAATLNLTTDYTNRRPADEPTLVRVAQDGSAIDVAFDVTQRESIVVATTTNGSSVPSDDYVEVALSPNGPLGFQYAFYANPRGARYQTSSENSAYSPPWSAAAAGRPGGYTITMRIPLAIIRSGGRTTWRAQFVRSTVRTNALDVWAFSSRASNVIDATFFGPQRSAQRRSARSADRARILQRKRRTHIRERVSALRRQRRASASSMPGRIWRPSRWRPKSI